jgi:Spy/CpxP family protein refolding chaperone
VKKMKKTFIVLSLAAVVLLGLTYVYADDPAFGPAHKGMYKHEYRGPKVSNLTPEQRTKFQELRRKFNDETPQLKGALLTKRLELQSLWTNPNADSKAILDKERELRDLQNQMRDKVVQYMLEARKILTPEQMTEFGQHHGMGFGFGRRHMMAMARCHERDNRGGWGTQQ